MPTTDRLRHDIDRGQGGDKIDAPDPAAAPLGTDEEAAGTPVPREAIARAYAQEIGSGRTKSKDDEDHAVAIYVVLTTVIATTLLSAIWLGIPPATF